MSDPVRIIVGDCLEAMRGMDAASVDAIVTDPPYGLSFMGKHWDHGVPGVDFWIEALRVAKPGTHLLAFGGTRTYHRLACAIEDAGWEVRDCIAWVYGSGFPKSLDVSKAIDKVNGHTGRLHRFTAWMQTTGLTAKQINEVTGTFMGSHYLTSGSQPAIPTPDLWAKLRLLCGNVPAWVDELVDRIEAKREVVGRGVSGIGTAFGDGEWAKGGSQEFKITAPATDLARQWSGWGTALKPAFEPIIVARKPLIGTVAENVSAHGTGAINVDGCRVGETVETWPASRSFRAGISSGYTEGIEKGATQATGESPAGRWPSNLIHDGSDEVVGLFPNDGEQSAARFFYCAKASRRDREEGLDGFKPRDKYGPAGQWGSHDCFSGKSGDDAWKAKHPNIPKTNHHPTVKPTALMRYLCRLVTPPGGIVLDPFAGSGSTGKGAVLEGFNFIGIELDAEYAEIARARIGNATSADKGLFA